MRSIVTNICIVLRTPTSVTIPILAKKRLIIPNSKTFEPLMCVLHLNTWGPLLSLQQHAWQQKQLRQNIWATYLCSTSEHLRSTIESSNTCLTAEATTPKHLLWSNKWTNDIQWNYLHFLLATLSLQSSSAVANCKLQDELRFSPYEKLTSINMWDFSE